MKKILVTFLTTLLITISYGQISEWSWGKRINVGASTHDLRQVITDPDGNVFVFGRAYEAFSGFSHIMAIQKLDSSGTKIWNKTYEGWVDGDQYDLYLRNDGDLIVVGSYRGFLNLTDTSLSAGTNSIEKSMVFRFDKDTGDEVWVKECHATPYFSYVDDANNLFLMTDAYKGNVLYDNKVIGNVPDFKSRTSILKINTDDGLLINNVLTDKLWIKETTSLVNKNEIRFVTGQKYGDFETLPYSNYLYGTYNMVTNVINYGDTLSISGEGLSSRNYFMDPTVSLFYKDHYYLAFPIDRDFVLNGNDTLKQIENVTQTIGFIKLDTNMNVVESITVSDINMLEANDSMIVFTSELPYTTGGLVINDNRLTTVDTKGKGCLIVSTCNTELENFKHYPVYSETWENEVVAKDLSIDNENNLYVLFHSGKDIICTPDVVESFNKSWAHLNVLGKISDRTIPTGLFKSVSKERFIIYPNPASSVINSEIGQLEIFDALGTSVLRENSTGKVDVTSLKSGLYLVIQNGKRAKLIIE